MIGEYTVCMAMWAERRLSTYTKISHSNGWGASAVDAFSTALVMGNTEVIHQILEFVPSIDFTNTSTEISLFETTIRYLGGLLSGG